MKTSDLIGPALDWAVAKCIWPDDIGNTVPFHHDGSDYAPSRKWAHGGPIIERECMEFDYDEATQIYTAANGIHAGQGRTHLIAAMRCFVASRLGDEVDIPEELL